MLELKSVNKFYNSNGVVNLGLRNINLRLDKGEIVAIVGDSGSGKSTLLNVICKNDDFDEGEIYYKGNETSYFSVKDMDDFRKNKIGFIFQNYNIIDSYTVLENVMLPLILKGIDRSEAQAKAKELIEKVGLKGKEKNRGTKLSGGEKQRCVIARALASDCEILACDEPTGNLDSKTSKEIINLIKEIAQDKLVLIVTHNFEDFQDIVTRKIRISDGEIVEDVKYLTVEEDANEDLDLDYVKLPLKTDLMVARNNIIFTPKKSIFLSCIFLVVFILTFFLLQMLIVDINSYSTNNYRAGQSDRFYIYSTSSIDLSQYESSNKITKVVKNPFFEDQGIEVTALMDEDGYKYESYCSAYVSNYVHDAIYYVGDASTPGVKLIFPYKDSYNEAFYNQIIDIPTFNIQTKVTGIAYSNLVKNKILLFDEQTFAIANARSYYFKLSTPNGETKKLEAIDAFYLGEDVINTHASGNIDALVKPKLLLPKAYQNVNVELYLAGVYKMGTDEIEVVYTDDVSEPYILTGLKCEYITYEASVYSKNDNEIKKISENLGYKYDQTSKIDSDNQTLEGIISEMASMLQLVSIASVLIIAFFITFFILQKVYTSKKNDYQILRTLGVTKEDMSKITLIEVGLIGLVTIILALIIGIILFKTNYYFYEFSNIKFSTVLIYLVFTTLFTIATANRFNKKLFKFTVSKSLKE